jgi:hypothetical protein
MDFLAEELPAGAGKNSVTVLQPPQVEKRSLDYYESLVWEGVQ